jgi:predicted ATPase
MFKSMKRYALCGAHGTGKTTVLKDISDYLLDNTSIIPIFNTSNARKLSEMGVKINDKGDDFVQYVVQASHVSRFAEPNWFADRCVVDGFAYMEAAWRKKLVSQECWDTVHNLMNTFAPLYTQIFYVPIEFEMENDGIRKVDIEYQREIDHYMKRILELYNNVTTLKGSRDERKEIVLKYIA